MRPAARFLARAAALALLLAAPAAAQFGNEIAYQAQLRNNGAPVTTACDFQFSLWTADIGGGTQVGTTVERLGIPGSDGLFRTTADFGVNPYTTSQQLWLQVAVRNPAGTGSYVAMTPRQRLTASPFSLGTRGLTVNSSSNVGIGTAAPADRMHVAGGRIRVEQESGVGTNSPGVLILSNGTKSNFVFTDSVAAGGHLNIRTDSATNHVILQNGGTQGNVGIGTGSPGSLLSMGTSLDTTKPKLSLWESGTDRWGFGMQASTMTFWTGGTVKAALDSDGEFGIGTLTPMNPLEVVRSTNPSIAITQSGGARCELAVAAGLGNWSSSALANDMVIRHTNGSQIHLLSGSGGSALTIRGDNNVVVNNSLGVGINPPTQRLHVNGNALVTGDVTAQANLNGNRLFVNDSATGINKIGTSLSGNARLSVTSQASGGEQYAVVGFGSFCSTTGTYANCSDERLKKDIKPIEGALSHVLSLRPVGFSWRADEFPEMALHADRGALGFIAQDLQKVFPSLVFDGPNDFLAISMTELIPVLTAAMQEQQKQIEALKTESSDLRATNAALAARLERIEAYLQLQANRDAQAPETAVAAK